MNKHIRIRRDTAANWTEYNPVLRQGEVGYVLDNYIEEGGVRYYVTKIGDGDTVWNDLPRASFAPKPSGGGSGGSVAWADVTGKPTEFTPSAHTHGWSEITGKPSTFAPSAHTHGWDEVTSKPTEFTPSAHSHTWSEITEKPKQFNPAAHTHAISDVDGLEAALDDKAAFSHAHEISDVTGLQFALDGKANTNHSHPIPLISNPATTVAAGTTRWIPVGGSNPPATSAGSYTNAVPRALTTVNMRCTLVFTGPTTAAGSLVLFRNGTGAGNATTLVIPIPIGSSGGVFEFASAVGFSNSDTWVIQVNAPVGTAIQVNNVILNYL